MQIIQGVFTSLKRILANCVNIVVFQGEKVDLYTTKIVIRNDLDPVVIEIKCPLALRLLNRWQLRKAFVATVDDLLIPVTLAGQGQSGGACVVNVRTVCIQTVVNSNNLDFGT